MKNSIEYNENGDAVLFTGPLGVSVYQAAVLSSSIKLFLETGMKPLRGFGMVRMIAKATELTGITYKKSRLGLKNAVEDLENLVKIYKFILNKNDR